MRTNCLSYHTKAERVKHKGRNELCEYRIDADAADLTFSCQFQEEKECETLACPHTLERKLTCEPETH
jgi:hypothetical protein